MKYNRLLPLLIPLFTLVLLEVFSFKPKFIYAIVVILNLSIIYAIRRFSKAGGIDKKWFNFIIFPCLLFLSSIFYAIFLSSKLLIQLIFIADTVLLYVYLKYVYYYLVRPVSYEVFSIENISSYGNFLSFFLASSAIFGLQSFLNIKIWLLMIIILVVILLVVYQNIWANKIDLKKSAIYLFVCCLVLIEVFWSIAFLPVNFNVAGLVLAICYYILSGLIKYHLLGSLDKNKIKLYLGFGLSGIFIILFTAKWL